MRQKKAKALRRAMQNRNGATKSKVYTVEYFPVQKTVSVGEARSAFRRNMQSKREQLSKMGIKIDRALLIKHATKVSPIAGSTYTAQGRRIVADGPRRQYQSEKKLYNVLPRKLRAGIYPER